MGPAICPQSCSHHPAQEPPHPGRREERSGLDSEAREEWSQPLLGAPGSRKKRTAVPLLTRPYRAFILLLRPTPSTQDSAGLGDSSTSPLEDEGPANTLAWVSWPEGWKVKTPKRTDTDRQAGKGLEREPGRERAQTPAGKGKTHPPSDINNRTATPKHNAPTPTSCLTSGKQPSIPGRTRGRGCGAAPSVKSETNSGAGARIREGRGK